VIRIGGIVALGIAVALAAGSSRAQSSEDREALYRQAVEMEQGGKATESLRIYRRAAKAGSGKAAKRLGDIFSCGALGIARDYGESLRWYDMAFRLGEPVPTRRDC